MPTYRDSHHKTLADYPRPSVAVDTAVLTVTPERQLAVLLVEAGATAGAGTTASSSAGPGTSAGPAKSPTSRRLPGTFLHEGERLADAVLRSLRDKAGIEGLAPRQLHVFDEPERDDRGWVLSVAHLVAVPFDRVSQDRAKAAFVPVSEVEPLPYGHNEIVARAVATLRADYAEHPDPAALVAGPFTLTQLRQTHEVLAGEALQRDAFRRAMEPQLRKVDARSEGSVGKPAQLYTRA
ncbi:hypothetical protein AX769_11420 [Frondihabitans sp. PAMC 28766]|uniref:NUDIX hydrolase n=1 Tax=Frondihabitans sp. PAMC 28766 TaxID=1795630 RepID=UPI00078E0B71|nr:NUDIX hydrolase [Frondihabitans sp. PAMC 28766]AMM20641.1 hypothetical protein AX769_11420 [Frondihabitans sp. PAMC 28766]